MLVTVSFPSPSCVNPPKSPAWFYKGYGGEQREAVGWCWLDAGAGVHHGNAKGLCEHLLSASANQAAACSFATSSYCSCYYLYYFCDGNLTCPLHRFRHSYFLWTATPACKPDPSSMLKHHSNPCQHLCSALAACPLPVTQAGNRQEKCCSLWLLWVTQHLF